MAIKSQGTLLYIGGSAGSAKTVSAVTVGTITKIVFTGAHGWAVGDYITFDSNFAGANASTLNGKSVFVKALEGTTGIYFDTISTSGLTITAGTATGTAAAWTKVGNLTDLKALDGSGKEIEATNHDSTATEYMAGLPDHGGLSASVDGDLSDTGHLAVEAARTSSLVKAFKYVISSGSTPTCSFNAIVKKFDDQLPVNDKYKRSIELRITGAISRA